MEPALKQRLVGAAVLVALAVIFLPMLVQGPAPESGVADVPLNLPAAPGGAFETRDLPLVTPGAVPNGGVVGMDASAPLPADAPVTRAADAVDPADAVDAAIAAATPADALLPAASAGGNYAVSFGAYANTAAAETVIAALRGAQLPGFREPATIHGTAVQRVRIGPYATRAEAEAARLRAGQVRTDVVAKVVALDAESAAATPAPAVAKPAVEKPATDQPAVVKPAVATAAIDQSATEKPAVAKPATPKPVAVVKPASTSGVGFAVQLGAFSHEADATALRDKLRAAGFSAFTDAVDTDKGRLTRVRVGPVLERGEADQLLAQVKSKVGLDGIVRPHP